MGIKCMQGTHSHITRLEKSYKGYCRACCPNFEKGFCTLYAECCSHVDFCDKYIEYSDEPEKERKKYNAKVKRARGSVNKQKKKSSDVNKHKKKTKSKLNEKIEEIKRKNKYIEEKNKIKNECKKRPANIGKRIELLDINDNEKFIITLDYKKKSLNYVTPEVPLGKAILNKKVGDIVEICVEDNMSKFKILKIK